MHARIASRPAAIALALALAGSALAGCAGTSHTTKGAGAGAAAGGTLGALIGNQMDKQAAEMKSDLEGVEVERVDEGIKLKFQSGILFATDSADLSAEARQNLDKLAGIFKKYADTNIIVEGHTDSTGTHEHNMVLSRRRAESVVAYLATQGVSAGRMVPAGYGPDQPIASNDTAAGRALNRRVEVAVIADEKLKKAAEAQATNG